ncbi:Rha family transcriptional regulator [Bartonella sp. B17]
MNTFMKTIESASNGAAVQTMSSREIAALCDKKHRNVMRDIRQIFTELKIELSEFTGLYKDSTGRTLPCYNLPKRECLILVSGYSTTLRAKIVDRWQELEKQVSAPQIDYSSPEAMIGIKDKNEQKAILFVDNMARICLLSNQVPQKHLKSIADRLPKQSLLRTLKALTHYTLRVYNGFVGCGYAIQYPLWGKHNDGLSTVFLSTRHSSGVSIKNL